MKKSIERIAWALSRMEPEEKENNAHQAWQSCVASVGAYGLLLHGDDHQRFCDHCKYEYNRNRKQP